MEKVKLPKHVAEALDQVIGKYQYNSHIVRDSVVGNDSIDGMEIIIRYFRRESGNISDELLHALVIGYEGERTPEERLRDYYEYLQRIKSDSIYDDLRAETQTKDDADFIAHAREDISKLLAEIERLRTGIERAINETSCDDTWDYLNRLLEGKETTDLPYRIGGDSE